MAYNIGLTGPYPYTGSMNSDFFAAMAIYYANRAPLVTRLPNVASPGETVNAVDDQFRPKSVNLGAALTDGTGTTVTLADASPFLVGDVLQVESELMQITADPNVGANTVTVTRGYAGTTGATHSNSTPAYLIGNARTGGEVDQTAGVRPFDITATTHQTVQIPYQIGGRSEADSRAMAIPLGFASLVGYQRAKAAQEALFDLERSMYYGQYAAVGSNSTRPMMRGLRQRLVTNRVTSPTNASAYKPSDFVRDFLTPCTTGGGNPDVCFLSDEYRIAFAVWSLNLTLLSPDDTQLGQNIEAFVCSGINAKIVFAPLLRPYAGFTLTSQEALAAWKRELQDYPRGRRGDATEGDVIGDACLIVNNEAHHAWVEGVTGFAKQS